MKCKVTIQDSKARLQYKIAKQGYNTRLQSKVVIQNEKEGCNTRLKSNVSVKGCKAR